MLPVTSVDGLGEGFELVERVWFAYMANLVLDTSRESGVELTVESTVTITSDLGGETLELYDILVNVVSIPHNKLFELRLSVPLQVMRTKVLLELGHELRIVIHPKWTIVWSTRGQEIWFKPFQCHALEI